MFALFLGHSVRFGRPLSLLRRALCGIDTGAAPLSAGYLLPARVMTRDRQTGGHAGDGKIFHRSFTWLARQTGGLPHLTSENSEWRNNDKFHVTFVWKMLP
ncbi:hypothetical protein KCP69_21165 [Salmonella enterica subsp. enterica]|nr:hypothetical protein KCP69_21165 [Salmonella enterica subsp. enterica]